MTVAGNDDHPAAVGTLENSRLAGEIKASLFVCRIVTGKTAPLEQRPDFLVKWGLMAVMRSAENEPRAIGAIGGGGRLSFPPLPDVA